MRTRDKVAMFLLGAINNLPYVIGIASAQRIVKNYNKPSYLGLVLWANTLSGLFARFINTWLASLSVPYEVNFCANAASMLFGLLGCAFSPNFPFTLVCIFFIGFSSSFGESVLLCYITIRRKQYLLTSWSSGTGMAGIIGASYSLICSMFTIAYFWSFIAVSPVVLVYIWAFFGVIYKSPDEPDDSRSVPLIGENSDKERAEIGQLDDQPVSFCDFSILRPVWWFMFNCGAVYFLEYVIQGAFVDCCLTKEQNKKYKYMFPLLNLMYQIGVFISRSSLALFKFPWVGWLTIGQLCFFVAWSIQPFIHYLPVWGLISSMICVGLFGGCSYVNSFYLIMNSPTLNPKQKEMVTSWNAFFISIFISLSTIFTLIAENTFLSGKLSE